MTGNVDTRYRVANPSERDYQAAHTATEIQRSFRLKGRFKMCANHAQYLVDVSLARLEKLLERFVIKILAAKSILGKYSKIRLVYSKLNPVFVRFISQNVFLRYE